MSTQTKKDHYKLNEEIKSILVFIYRYEKKKEILLV